MSHSVYSLYPSVRKVSMAGCCRLVPIHHPVFDADLPGFSFAFIANSACTYFTHCAFKCIVTSHIYCGKNSVVILNLSRKI